MRSYLGQRACKAGRPERPHKAHSARPLFTHLLSPRAHTPATPAQGLSPSFDVQEQKTAIKCCFKEGVLAALHLSGESRGLRGRGGGAGGRRPEKKGVDVAGREEGAEAQNQAK